MNIYVLTALHVIPKTEEMIQQELEIRNIKYEKKITLEQYKKFEEDWNKFANKYKITCSEENAYFIKEEDALWAARNNLADINEAGAYNYIIVTGVEEGRMYTNCIPKAFYVFKYNSEIGKYEDVPNTDEVYQFLAIGSNASLLKGKPKIVLNLSKEEKDANQNFVQSLKESFEKKDYSNVKKMIDEKEDVMSESLNEVLNDISSQFENIGHSIQNVVDFFNGKF